MGRVAINGLFKVVVFALNLFMLLVIAALSLKIYKVPTLCPGIASWS